MDFLPFLLSILFFPIGFFFGGYVYKLKSKASSGNSYEKIAGLEARLLQSETLLKKSEEAKQILQSEKEFLGIDKAKMQVNLKHLEEKNKEQNEAFSKLQEKFTKEFENLANKILDEKSQKFTHQNKENITNILLPLQEKIQLFEKKVSDSQKENIHIHAALKEQLITLQSQNLKITQEAENLTKALKGDSKMQGNWGELVLERVLEKSGLERDREFFVQQSFTNDQGQRLLPDVVLHLPEGKRMIIDAKVSLTSYERYINCEDEDERLKYLKEHVNSLKKHVEQLSAKNYFELYDIESPDFVLLFVPIEPAFALALNHDNSLYTSAFEKNIVIVTPTTLLATLRTIDSMWTNEKQQQNAIEIATQAGRLYDAFHRLSEDLLKIGDQMDRAKGSYSEAMRRLTDGPGNLVSRVEKLKKLGAKATKQQNEKLLRRAQDADSEES